MVVAPGPTPEDLLARLRRLRARLVEQGRSEAVSALDAAIADAEAERAGRREGAGRSAAGRRRTLAT